MHPTASDPSRPGSLVDARRLRIVAIIPGDDYSGPAGQVASTAVELIRRGADVRFVLLRRPASVTGRLPAFLRRRGIPCEELDDRGPADFRLLRAVSDLLNAWQPHIVETHGYKASAVAHWLRRRGAAWRWVGFFHGFTTESRRARFYHWLDHRMLGRADATIAVTEQQRKQMLAVAPRTRVVRNAVTILDVEPDSDALAISAERPRIGIVGRLSPEKGVDVFLHAAAILSKRGVPFSALVAGDGPERDVLERIAESAGFADRVSFLGRVGAIRKLYEVIDLLVIPSRSEGLPSVLLEALAADVPVVATRVGAIPEVLAHPASGIVVPPESPELLADAIERALQSLDDPEARAARALAADAYSQTRRADTLMSLYRELVPEAV